MLLPHVMSRPMSITHLRSRLQGTPTVSNGGLVKPNVQGTQTGSSSPLKNVRFTLTSLSPLGRKHGLF
jgi:hypothetical protein